MAGLAIRKAVTTSKVDLFSGGYSSTGSYEVIIKDVDGVDVFLATDNGAATTDALNFNTVSTDWNTQRAFRFTWDSSTPLYAFTSSGTANLQYMLCPISSVGLSVNCS